MDKKSIALQKASFCQKKLETSFGLDFLDRLSYLPKFRRIIEI